MTRAQNPSYSSFRSLHNRCTNPNSSDYPRYGGRGIRCLWNNFIEFITDMGMRPSMAHSIDRIDNDGNYEASNCRWATRIEQAANKSSNGIKPGTPQGFYHSDDPMQYIRIFKGKYQLTMTMLPCGIPEYIGRYNTLEEAQAVREICKYERNVYVNLGLIDN